MHITKVEQDARNFIIANGGVFTIVHTYCSGG